MYGSWYKEHDRQIFLSFWMIFCPFSPLTTQKIKILEKWKIHGDFANLHMCTIHENHMIHDSWDMEHDRQNFLSSWVIFALLIPLAICKINILKKMKKKPWGYYHFTHVYHKLEENHAWFLRYGVWRTKFFVILDNFFSFYPTNNPKTPADIIILQMCNVNENQMMYGSSDMECKRQNFCHFGPFSALLPKNNLKNQNFEKMKK